MTDTGGRRRRHRDERIQGNAFMDTIRDAYVRWVALDRWRDIEDLCASAGLDAAGAIEEAGRFPTRGPYRDLWRARWQAEVHPDLAADAGALFGAIERAVAAGLRDEEVARCERGDRPLDEDVEYKAFVDGAMERLLAEAAGDIGATGS